MALPLGHWPFPAHQGQSSPSGSRWPQEVCLRLLPAPPRPLPAARSLAPQTRSPCLPCTRPMQGTSQHPPPPPAGLQRPVTAHRSSGVWLSSTTGMPCLGPVAPKGPLAVCVSLRPRPFTAVSTDNVSVPASQGPRSPPPKGHIWFRRTAGDQTCLLTLGLVPFRASSPGRRQA